jgi:hypothetical protein
MRGRWRRDVAFLLIALSAAGCGERPPVEIPPPTMPTTLVARCGDLRIGLEMLSNPLGAERGGTPEAQALRRFVTSHVPAGEPVDPAQYRIIRKDEASVLYASEAARPPGEEGAFAISVIAVSRIDGRWSAQLAGTCVPEIDLPGLHAATWSLDLDVLPGVATRRFTALVSETSCVGGQPADGRVVAPLIRREISRVVVTFGIVPPEGMTGPQPCPMAPPTRVEVDLGEPLGARELLDGGTIPPRSPIQVSCCG